MNFNYGIIGEKQAVFYFKDTTQNSDQVESFSGSQTHFNLLDGRSYDSKNSLCNPVKLRQLKRH